MPKDKVYRVISRVVENNEVIGFMVCPLHKKSEEIFMSLDVLNFGLRANNFRVENVKLGSNGKPRGYNGFLLSKLPIVELENDRYIRPKIILILKFIVRSLGITEDISNKIDVFKVGAILNCSVKIELKEYIGIDKKEATEDLNKNLEFYLKALPNDLREYKIEVKGTLEEKGKAYIVVSHNLVFGG